MQDLEYASLPKLSDLDGRKTQLKIEALFQEFHYYRLVGFDEREAKLTAGYSDMPGSGGISDQTSSIAVHNTVTIEQRRRFCDRLVQAVDRLPKREREIINLRYMSDDYAYVKDVDVRDKLMNPAMPRETYVRYRFRAFYSLALILDRMGMLRLTDLIRGEDEA